MTHLPFVDPDLTYVGPGSVVEIYTHVFLLRTESTQEVLNILYNCIIELYVILELQIRGGRD